MFIAKVFSFSFVCLLAVCGNSVSQTEIISSPQQKDKTELSLKMEKTECLGSCPVYTLTIEPSGKVVFEGKFWTKIKGKAEDTLSEEKINNIIAEIDKANFFSLKDSYTENSGNCPYPYTDNSTVILFIKLRGNEKTIPHSLGCYETLAPTFKIFPQQLFNLENKIDEIVETKRWIGERK